MDQSQLDKSAYGLAWDYLLTFQEFGIEPKTIEKYLSVHTSKQKPDSIRDLYKRLLSSAQNANMKAGVIGKSIGGFEHLGTVLYAFDPNSVIENYKDWESILDNIESTLKPRGKVRRTTRSIWPKYCQTILSAAQFITQFSSALDFYKWVDFFDSDSRARAALPQLIHLEINGLGFALACDFLKELGYSNFAKPDIHIRKIFVGLELCDNKASDYALFKAVVRVANNVGVSPYNADKLFWLVGSGYFYDDSKIGKNGRIPTKRDLFIENASKKLRPNKDE